MLQGRSAELAVVDGVLADVVRGRPFVVTMGGDEGSGLTALLDEATDRAAASGATVLVGRGRVGGAAPAFSGLLGVLRPVEGRFEELAGAEAADVVRRALALDTLLTNPTHFLRACQAAGASECIGQMVGNMLVVYASGRVVAKVVHGPTPGAEPQIIGVTDLSLSGRTVLGENWDAAVRAARGATPVPGFHDVIAHGTPTGIYDAGGNLLSTSEAAAIIRSTPSWEGQNVRLLSCSTGCPGGEFAQNLANELGVDVLEPTVDFYVNSRGVPILDPGGTWITYSPEGG